MGRRLSALVVLGCLLVVAASCKSKTQCVFTLAVSTTTLPAAGGSGGASVTPAPSTSSCSWTATSDQPWLTLSGTTSGNAQGTFTFQAAGNGAAAARNANITLSYKSDANSGADTKQITQASEQIAAQLSVDPTTRTVGNSAQSGLTIAVTSNLPWTATSDQSWLTITGGSAGGGSSAGANGTVTYSVAANSGSTRTGTITLSGSGASATHVVTQSQSVLTLDSGARTLTPAAQTQMIQVTSNVSWTAASNDTAWLTIASGASGTNNGTITYSATANNGATRNATITVSGGGLTAKHVVDQTGLGVSINPTSTTVNATARTGLTAAVTAGGSWTAAVTAGGSFLTITGGSSGNGSGTVTFSVSANLTGTSRTGTITVTSSGQTAVLNVTQTGVMPSFVVTSTGTIPNKCQITDPSTTIKCNFDASGSAPSSLITKYDFRFNSPSGTLLGSVNAPTQVLSEPTTSCGLYNGTEVTVDIYLIVTLTGGGTLQSQPVQVTFRKQGACGV